MSRMKFGDASSGIKQKGTLIVVEGMDGSGKSTLVEGLTKVLPSPVQRTKEPTHGKFGTLLRERQADGARYTPLEEYWLFMLDRTEHGHQLRKWLAEGLTVISDRFWHSTWVYQTALLWEGDLRRHLLELDVSVIVPTPDLLVILDLDVETAHARILQSRGELDAFETPSLLAQYREGYLQLAQKHKGLVLDATLPPEELVNGVVVALKNR